MTELPAGLPELEAAARESLPTGTYDYYAGGAEDEITLAANRTAWDEFSFRPRRLVDVSRLDTSLELLGHTLPHPGALAPTAFQKLAHAEGELATARATGGALMVASSLSSHSVEEIVEAVCAPDLEVLRVLARLVQNGEIVIVDEFTGRLAEGRKWRAGIAVLLGVLADQLVLAFCRNRHRSWFPIPRC